MNPSSATYHLFDLMKRLNFSEPQFPHLYKSRDNSFFIKPIFSVYLLWAGPCAVNKSGDKISALVETGDSGGRTEIHPQSTK